MRKGLECPPSARFSTTSALEPTLAGGVRGDSQNQSAQLLAARRFSSKYWTKGRRTSILGALNNHVQAHIRIRLKLRNTHIPVGHIAGALLVAAFVLTPAACADDHERAELASLTDEYLNPVFSDEVLRYWQIERIPYRHRLVQEYFLSMVQAEGLSAVANSAEDMLRYSRLLLTNWPEEELILRTLMVIEAESAEGAPGRLLVDGDPLDEEILRDELGPNTEIYARYRDWLDRVLAGGRL